MTATRVGFVGLGNMGTPMAKSLLKRGFPMIVYDVRKEAARKVVPLGAQVAGSCRELAAASDVIISMVRDIPQTEGVIFGSDGVWEGLAEGKTLIISSTLTPAYCRMLYARAKEKKVSVLDCAVSDPSGQRHRLGGLTLMIGGDEDAVRRCWPIFEALGKNIFHMGGIGTGQACKLVHQINAFNISTVTRESLDLGLRAGLDLPKMIEALSTGLGSTKGLQRMAATFKSRRRTAGKAPVGPPASARAAGAGAPPANPLAKDVQLAMAMADEVKASVPIARFIAEVDATSTYPDYSAAMKRYMP